MALPKQRILSLVLLVLAVVLGELLTTCDCQSYVMCRQGEYLELADGWPGHCETCPIWEYMDEDHHNHTSCKKCLVPNFYGHYDVIENCSKTHDTIIKCWQNYYYDGYLPDTPCQKCKVCASIGQFVAVPCTENKNTICCPHKGMLWRNGSCTNVSLVVSKEKDIAPRQGSIEKPCVENFIERRDKCLEDEYVWKNCSGGAVICSRCPYKNQNLNHSCSSAEDSDNEYSLRNFLVGSVITVGFMVSVTIFIYCVWCQLIPENMKNHVRNFFHQTNQNRNEKKPFSEPSEELLLQTVTSDPCVKGKDQPQEKYEKVTSRKSALLESSV